VYFKELLESSNAVSEALNARLHDTYKGRFRIDIATGNCLVRKTNLIAYYNIY